MQFTITPSLRTLLSVSVIGSWAKSRRTIPSLLIYSKRGGRINVVALLLIALSTAIARDVQPAYEVYFSPKGGATDAVERELERAKKTVLVQAYSFTSARIAKALVDAHKRGVAVTVILDKSQRSDKYTSATFLKNAGVATFIDDEHAIAHNKVMVIDAATVITGSFNFTKAAEESNAENLLIIRDATLAGKYVRNWMEHGKHSTPYTTVVKRAQR